MALVFNGTTITTIVFNGTTMTNVYYNGTEVHAPAAVQTATPSIGAGNYFVNQWIIPVTNNDASTAVIYAEENDSTPDINRGNVNSGASVNVTSSQPSFATFTMYATAQASGETLSAVASRTIT